MKLAIIRNKIVKNIVVGSYSQFPDGIDITDKYVGIGWELNDDGTFTNPAPKVEHDKTKCELCGQALKE